MKTCTFSPSLKSTENFTSCLFLLTRPLHLTSHLFCFSKRTGKIGVSIKYNTEHHHHHHQIIKNHHHHTPKSSLSRLWNIVHSLWGVRIAILSKALHRKVLPFSIFTRTHKQTYTHRQTDRHTSVFFFLLWVRIVNG